MMARNNGIIAIRRVGYLSSTSSLSTLIPNNKNNNNHHHIRNFHSNNNCRYIHSYQHQNQQQQHAIYRSPSSGSSLYFSSTAAPDDNNSGPGGVRGWMNDRRDRQEQERYIEQMTRLSDMEAFTMENYRDELSRGVHGGGIMSKIPFMQTKEVEQAKEVVDVVKKIIEVVGPHATAEDLLQMDRLQRLRVATTANKTLEEISIMVSQITNMDVMQKTLRKRRLEGKPIPPDKDSMQSVIQKDAINVLSKSQRDMLKSRQVNNAKRMARKRRS
ncbi:hypothetical protein FRACYDRAFT_234614 [Fragilariopsis cylindrus CCMP1102]|uniref:Signal recognition particle SRP54 subunit M-domain domain-containing protein n=1 Tax=Fragilariopsis cylindrus CCMP1102 TaxID=635003 RepID=A0A1E7FS33_9STRA|nr:hypothetical protein FRACYDRAFT_234614 [Fragilariopsis cylindrus CCMP1102]|eukprot:OEU20982.1 hypothetical protein FRACYDRAFT_234614 [Fragilariopsis cylindrus CCMP1102]